ncbi:hypothetical protein H9P43_009604 [Blastocladiella emersonii ATCC 22665]|nr:hypothetical protein H9P43_009604 [Blastocladiella emersonii ATCC 22665]
MLEWIPDRTADFQYELEELWCALQQQAMVTEEVPRVEFFAVVAISAAMHMNLDALEAVFAHHPRPGAIMALLETPCVYSAFLERIDNCELKDCCRVLDWLAARGWSPRIATDDWGRTPCMAVSMYLSPARFRSDDLLLVFEKYDRARLADLTDEVQRNMICCTMLRWIDEDHVEPIFAFAQAWSWLAEFKYWATFVTRFLEMDCSEDGFDRLLLGAQGGDLQELLGLMLRAVSGSYSDAPKTFSQLISVAIQRCGYLATVKLVVEHLDAFADRTFGIMLDSLGIGSTEARVAIADRLLELLLEDDNVYDEDLLGALATTLVPVLADAGASSPSLEQLVSAGSDETSRTRWSTLYVAFLVAVSSECSLRTWAWRDQFQGRALLHNDHVVPAWRSFLASCPVEVVDKDDAHLVERIVEPMGVLCRTVLELIDPRDEDTKRELALAEAVLRAAADHAPACFAELLLHVREGDASIVRCVFPEGFLGSNTGY